MKKLFAIVLLGILLFNWGGYRFVTDYLEDRADQILEAALDQENYDEAALISIKVPTNLPYYSNSATYERVDGSITINGVAYKYVKRRIYNDSLEVMCIPNVAKAGLQSARDDFFRLANDLVSNTNTKKSNGNHGHTVKLSIQDYTTISTIVLNPSTRYVAVAANTTVFDHFKSVYLDQLERPPQAES
ncbi:MAG: hypothetical protein K2Q21_01925 [Chitinophagaceae bacterium]|nr:hypothetical protein [Chitinophagaceae bacterium]